jgi:hypothetical protein
MRHVILTYLTDYYSRFSNGSITSMHREGFKHPSFSELSERYQMFDVITNRPIVYDAKGKRVLEPLIGPGKQFYRAHSTMCRNEQPPVASCDCPIIISEIFPNDLMGVIQSRDFKQDILSRGIPAWIFSKRAEFVNGLSADQMLAIESVTSSMKSTFNARLKEAGISKATWLRWMKIPQFASKFSEESEHVLRSSVASATLALSDRISNGDMTAINYAFGMLGRYDPRDKDTENAKVVMARVLDAITTNVSDPETLKAIAASIQSSQAATGLIKGELL